MVAGDPRANVSDIGTRCQPRPGLPPQGAPEQGVGLPTLPAPCRRPIARAPGIASSWCLCEAASGRWPAGRSARHCRSAGSAGGPMGTGLSRWSPGPSTGGRGRKGTRPRRNSRPPPRRRRYRRRATVLVSARAAGGGAEPERIYISRVRTGPRSGNGSAWLVATLPWRGLLLAACANLFSSEPFSPAANPPAGEMSLDGSWTRIDLSP